MGTVFVICCLTVCVVFGSAVKSIPPISYHNPFWALKGLVVVLCTAIFNVNKFDILRTQFLYVFRVDLRTNNDYFCVHC
jgi:hypothetical protein